MSTTTLNVANLDIDSIKESLINYLKNQNTFKDYDFNASNLSIILDTLAYNTFYNGYYLNMLANESFIDSAVLRDSVVSIAKHLGYTPSSINTNRAIIDIELTAPNLTKSYIVLPKNTKFNTYINSSYYTFYPDKDYICTLNNYNKYVCQNITLLEGTKLSQQYIVYANNINQKFLLNNVGIDINTVTVTVNDSVYSNNKTLYTQFDNLLELNGDSLVYFIEESQDKKYQIYFGDGILGKALSIGNVINIEYLVSSGENSESASNFKLATNIDSDITHINITTVSKASGYKDIESIDNIKLLAPLNYSVQSRLVTQSDYETIIKRNVPFTQYIKVWGGEENDPPYYGKVFVCIKPTTGLYLNNNYKQEIITEYIKPYAIISTDIEIVDPEYLYLVVDSNINYRINKTSLSSIELKSKVYEAIKTYISNELNGFETVLKYSKFISYIDDVDSSIDNNLTTMKLQYRVYPVLQTSYDINFKLNNELDNSENLAIYSTDFIYNNSICFIKDDLKGKLNIYSKVNGIDIIIKNNVGTVNYKNGSITIKNLLIDSIVDNQYIDFYAIPKINNIYALKNQLIIANDNDINVYVNRIE